MNKFIKNNLELIGNTPLVKVNIGFPKVTVLAKLETYNLTGSVKDRMALYMLKKAQQRGQLRPGGTIIEATTGNTGISFAALAAIFKYKMIAIMSTGQSQERIKMIQAFGAKVVLTPKKEGPRGAINFKKQLMEKIPKSWTPDQFDNRDNLEAHEKWTALEIIKQVKGKIDYFVHGVGTGGTLIGVAKGLKKFYPKIKIIAVEPSESAVLSGGKPGEHNIQGIGEGFIPSLVDIKLIDKVIKVSTKAAIQEAKNLAKKNGLLVGFSSGANIAAIKKLAQEIKGKKTILTIFADRGERYLSLY